MLEEMAADGPNPGLTEHLVDALYQAYKAFHTAHPGELSPATATHGVLAATAKILATVHGHASPDEEALVSWEAYKDACVAELDRFMREPHGASGAS